MLKTNKCSQKLYLHRKFEDLSNYANYLIKYAKTVFEMLRIRFYMKNYIRNLHFKLILLLKKLKIIKY